MKENIRLILKGFIIGLGKIIPGVSGAMLAITLGVYETGLKAVSNIFKEFKKYFKFLALLGIGIFLSVVLGSKAVMYCLNKFYLPTMLLFIGLIIGGIKPLFKEVKNTKVKPQYILIFCIVASIILGLSLLDFGQDKTNFDKNIYYFTIFFIGGLLEAAATVIPGISATALLMLLGYYNVIMTALSDIFNIANLANNMFILVPYGLGMIIGAIVIAKIMDYFFSHHKIGTYYAIIAFAITSVITLFIQTYNNTYSVSTIIVALVMLVAGVIISKKLDK